MRRLGSVAIALMLGVLWAGRAPPTAPKSVPRLPPTSVEPLDPEAGERLLRAATMASEVITRNESAKDALNDALRPLGPPPDQTRAAWRPFSAAIAEFEAVAERPGLSLPPPGEEPDDFWRVPTAGKALLVRGWDRAQDGRLEAGAGDMLRVFALGVRMVDAAEDALPLAIGTSLQGMALRELGELLDWSADPGAERVVLAGLSAHRALPGTMARVNAQSCEATKRLVAEQLQGPTAILDRLRWTHDVERMGISPSVANAVVAPFVYDAQATRDRIDAQCDAFADVLAQPAARRPSTLPWEEDPLEVRNRIGRAMTEPGAVPLALAAREERFQAAQSVLLTVAAARRFREETGHTPSSVSELVPRWLSTIPPDPYRAGGVVIERGIVRAADPGKHESWEPRRAIPIE